MIRALLEQFDRIRIISLPHRVDRRRRVLRELKKQGLEVDGQRIAFYDALCPGDANGFPSRADRGNLLSHAGVVEQALRDQVKNILVLEDDAIFVPIASDCVESLSRGLDQLDWHLLFLGWFGMEQSDGPAAWVPLKAARLGMHCYALHQSAFAEFVAHYTEVDSRPAGHPGGAKVAADPACNHFYLDRPEIKAFYARPVLSVQLSSSSDISPAWFDRIPVVSILADRARGLKNLLWSRQQNAASRGAALTRLENHSH
jgi:glycosyl transferase, family 25